MIKLIKSTFYHESLTKKELVKFILAADQLSFGRRCREFEKRFSIWQGRRDAVLVTSGSMANLALIQALLNLGRIKPGSRVGFSAVTWSTNVMPLIQLGLEPVPIDIDIKTLNITADSVRHAVNTYHIKMLFITNLLGFCGDMEQIRLICRENNVILIEDNCESLGSVYRGIKLGNFGLAATFSFYVGHHLSTVEGGAILTDDPDLAIMLRIVRAHGWDRNLTNTGKNQIRKRYAVNSEFYSRYTFYDMGYNMRPTEIVGFLGNCQLEYIEQIISHREKNFRYLAQKIYSRDDIYYPIQVDGMDIISNFAFPIILQKRQNRDVLAEKCFRKIEIRPIVAGNILRQPFFGKYIRDTYTCPNADLIRENGFYLGNNPEMTQDELDQIVKISTSI